MATLRTASPTKVPGHTALRSSSFVTSSPERAIRYWSTAKGLGLIFISSVPSHRHSLVKSRQKGSNTMMCFSFATGITKILRQVYDFHWTLKVLSARDGRIATQGGFRDSVSTGNGYRDRTIRRPGRTHCLDQGQTISLTR